MLRRILSRIPGLEGTEPTMTVGAPAAGSSSSEPCEDCGAVPADILVELRYLCPDCARTERERLWAETDIEPS